ncbi:Transposase [Marinobacterium sp. xm-a-152]|nr:Transposase [Marinobacterium sp. xm-a-152]
MKLAIKEAEIMKRKRYSVEQIMAALKQYEAGTTVAEICRKLFIPVGTFYSWKKDYGGLEPDQLRGLRLHVQLRREGHEFNKKRIHRLYCPEGRQWWPKRPRRNVSGSKRHTEQKPATAINESWAMDFVADQFYEGRKIRILTVIDTFSRECLATPNGPRLRS